MYKKFIFYLINFRNYIIISNLLIFINCNELIINTFDSILGIKYLNKFPSYKVVIDPGHGGAGILNQEGNKYVKSDKWDERTKTYLGSYATGMQANGFKESHVVLELSNKLSQYLELTKTDEGWEQFEDILSKFSNQKSFKRIIIESVQTRYDNSEDRFDKFNNQYVNNDYRMSDYVDDRGRLRRGRMSFINYHRPSLVISIHNTPAGSKVEGGMAAVLAPGYRSYKEVLNIYKKFKNFKRALATWKKSHWHGKVLNTESKWNQFQHMYADAWTYFHGYRSNEFGTGPDLEKPRGVRQNQVSWIYKDEEYRSQKDVINTPGPYSLDYNLFKPVGKFWERENSIEELWRREDGPLLYGGDNHYASDEIMRFVQYGVRLLKPHMRVENKIGPINDPFVSSYALPIYVNAIVAYVEIAYLNRLRDRELIIGEQDAVAKSMAVAIYSLYSGLELKKNFDFANPYPPRAQPLDIKKYKNYFEKVTD